MSVIASSDSSKAAENEALKSLDGLETIVYKTTLADLKGLTKNARYMTAEQFARLKGNIAADGVLTSVPLVYKHESGEVEIISGNHRVSAALAAGVVDGWVMEIVTRVSHERLVAIQLAHNAITGQDDVNQLKALYDELDNIDLKLYSGINDRDFAADPLDIAALSVIAPSMEEVTLAFLPEDAEAVRGFLKRLEKSKEATVLAASLTDYDRFFDTVVRVKGKLNIQNAALAIRAMLELACERLDEIEAAQAEAAKEATP